MKKQTAFAEKVTKKTKFSNVYQILFRKTQLFVKEGILTCTSFLKHPFSKKLSTFAVTSAFITWEPFPFFSRSGRFIPSTNSKGSEEKR